MPRKRSKKFLLTSDELLKRKDVAKFVKEFKALADGQSVVLNMPYRVTLAWDSDTSVSPYLDEILDTPWDKFAEVRRFQRRIKICVKRGDKLAKKYGFTKLHFWNVIINHHIVNVPPPGRNRGGASRWSGRNAASEKRRKKGPGRRVARLKKLRRRNPTMTTTGRVIWPRRKRAR